MKNRIFCGILGLLMALLNFDLLADMQAQVMSIPHAISAENIYKVTIVEIDGGAVEPARNYLLATGERTIKVRIMLKVEWSPILPGATDSVREKEIVLKLEAKTSYQIGAKLDINAAIESQLDGSYWEPILYRKFSD